MGCPADPRSIVAPHRVAGSPTSHRGHHRESPSNSAARYRKSIASPSPRTPRRPGSALLRSPSSCEKGRLFTRLLTGGVAMETTGTSLANPPGMVSGVKVFTATKARDREALGDLVTQWLR